MINSDNEKIKKKAINLNDNKKNNCLFEKQRKHFKFYVFNIKCLIGYVQLLAILNIE
jgi:hypothetical protein